MDSLTRVAKILIEAASMALAVIILRTPNVIGFTVKSFKNFLDSSVNPEKLIGIFNLSFSITLVVVIIVRILNWQQRCMGYSNPLTEGNKK